MERSHFSSLARWREAEFAGNLRGDLLPMKLGQRNFQSRKIDQNKERNEPKSYHHVLRRSASAFMGMALSLVLKFLNTDGVFTRNMALISGMQSLSAAVRRPVAISRAMACLTLMPFGN